MSKNKGGFLLGALFGSAIAGAAALLFAPKSGEEFRDDLKEELDILLDKANEYKDYAYDRSLEFYDVASEKTEDIKVNLKYSADQLRSQFEDVSHDAMQEMQRVKDELAKSTVKMTKKGQEFVESSKEQAQAYKEEISEDFEDFKDQVEEEIDHISEEI